MIAVWFFLGVGGAFVLGFLLGRSQFDPARPRGEHQQIGAVAITGIQGLGGWDIPWGIYTALISVSGLPPEVIGVEGKGLAMVPAEVPSNPLVIPPGATDMVKVGAQWTWDGTNDNGTRNNVEMVLCLWLILTLIDGRATRGVVYLPI